MTKLRRVGPLLARDFARFRPSVNYSPLRYIASACSSPGLMAVLLLRLQMLAVARQQHRFAGALRSLALALTGADFVPGCSAGAGLVIQHPSGIVFGGGAIVGEDCTVLQQVTLGERYADGRGPHNYPTIGDRCTIGAGAKILGGVAIGSDVGVGANSVVLDDIPSGNVVVGSPARIVERLK
ncbi:hypothetical protein [uncultured Microbacterium sp.]|uniref:serine O-acetyltransferase n=1 Tax=uncultured Microbacterium sp. TaxID=191216 RepID=UPI0034332A53